MQREACEMLCSICCSLSRPLEALERVYGIGLCTMHVSKTISGELCQETIKAKGHHDCYCHDVGGERWVARDMLPPQMILSQLMDVT